MGIVPLGTGNLFARNLGIPVDDRDDAVVLAFSGVDRAVDVIVADITRPDGSDESHVSLVMAGIGIDATMISNTNADLKKRVGWLAYVDAGLRAFPASKPYRATHRLDSGRHHRSKVATILVANLGYLPGNIELIPDAELDDGKLDVVVLQPRNFFGWLLIWRTVTWENRVLRKSTLGRQLIDLTGGNKRQHIVYLRGRAVEIGIEGAPEEFEIDGDEFGSGHPARSSPSRRPRSSCGSRAEAARVSRRFARIATDRADWTPSRTRPMTCSERRRGDRSTLTSPTRERARSLS